MLTIYCSPLLWCLTLNGDSINDNLPLLPTRAILCSPQSLHEIKREIIPWALSNLQSTKQRQRKNFLVIAVFTIFKEV